LFIHNIHIKIRNYNLILKVNVLTGILIMRQLSKYKVFLPILKFIISLTQIVFWKKLSNSTFKLKTFKMFVLFLEYEDYQLYELLEWVNNVYKIVTTNEWLNFDKTKIFYFVSFKNNNKVYILTTRINQTVLDILIEVYLHYSREKLFTFFLWYTK